MRGIYKRFKEDFQKGIKEMAEKGGVSPLEILGSMSGELFKECMTIRERIEKEVASDFLDTPVEDIRNYFHRYIDEVEQFICPGFINVPKESNLITADINRRLLEEGYDLINPEVLGLIVDEYLLPNCVQDED